jgi:hypothetical protein
LESRLSDLTLFISKSKILQHRTVLPVVAV